MTFAFDEIKNEILLRQRGVGFRDVIETIAEGGILVDFENPNQLKYPGQRVLVVNIRGYAYCVPYVVDGDKWFLKTVYPSRKFKYLIEGGAGE